MAVERKTIRVIETTTRLVLDQLELERTLRASIDMPANARMIVVADYDAIDSITFEWKVTEYGEAE